MYKSINNMTAFKREYSDHLELYKKETGIALNIEDIRTFAKFDRWLTIRMSDAMQATMYVYEIFKMLTNMHYKDIITFDGGIYIDPKNQNIYFPSNKSDADGTLFFIDPLSSPMAKYLETDPSACDILYKAFEEVKSMKKDYDYNELVHKQIGYKGKAL